MIDYIMTYIMGMICTIGLLIGFAHYATKGTILWEAAFLTGITILAPIAVLGLGKRLKERDNEST